jgi:hypothetical protein
MHIRVFQTATHIELIAESRSVTYPEMFPLLELAAGTPSVPQTEAFTLLDTLAVFLRGTTLRKALFEVNAPHRSLWLLEHIDIWNYAIEKGMIGMQIAYVATEPSVDRELDFAAKYAGKRGIMLKFFTARTDAVSWLLENRSLRPSGRDPRASPAFESGAWRERTGELATNF